MAKLYTRKSDGTYVPYNPQSVTNIDVVQATGDSVTATMSQDAVTKELATKQDTLTPSNGISIEGNMIGVTAITESESQPDTSLWLNPSEDEETDVTYNRSQIDAMVGAKQDALQLTVKDNGNIVLSNIQGQSKEFMPATPSGDPMHYAYEAAGAVWNGTGTDIVRKTPWADIVDDDADKTVVHKAGYWYLNGLGDITNEQMNSIFVQTNNLIEAADNYAGLFENVNCRVNIYKNASESHFIRNVTDWNSLAKNKDLEVLYFGYNTMYPPKPTNLGALVRFASSVYMIYCLFNCININNIGDIAGKATSLKYMYLKNITKSIVLKDCSKFANCCILYMIQNEAATSAITITLHPDAYARAMANADIVAALEAHPNVSLASA